MIYRYHVYDKPAQFQIDLSPLHKIALQSVLTSFPAQLQSLLDSDVEAHNEIMMKDSQEAYLKITTNETEASVSTAVQSLLRLSGLKGTRLI